MATQKCSQTRINALQQIANTMSTVYRPQLIRSSRATLLDILRKAIKHGNADEQSIGAHIVPLLILQIDDGEEIMKIVAPLISQVMLDLSNSSAVRAKCCSALTLAQFLADAQSDNTLELMQQLETMFMGCFLKGDAAEDESELNRTALNAWGLLLTRLPSSTVVKLFNREAFVL